MIKSWLKFNENSSDDIRSQLTNKLTEVRDVFTDLEDMGIISYGTIGRKSSYTVSDKDFCIIVDIKLPAEPNEFGSTVIGNESIKIFEDILIANSRLIDAGYDVKLDLNASHNQYKPVKFLIYFNI